MGFFRRVHRTLFYENHQLLSRTVIISLMQYRVLGATGLCVSALSYGASSLGGVFGDVTESEGIRTVHAAIDGGINFIDVSPYYGHTRAETVLGKALQSVGRDICYLA